jgi:hypothetical protein
MLSEPLAPGDKRKSGELMSRMLSKLLASWSAMTRASVNTQLVTYCSTA